MLSVPRFEVAPLYELEEFAGVRMSELKLLALLRVHWPLVGEPPLNEPVDSTVGLH